MTRKKIKIGIIAEDISDYESVKVLISRISNIKNLSTEKFLGKGCGKIVRKVNLWADTLRKKGCTILIVVHDSDENNVTELNSRIEKSLSPCPIRKSLIVIPIQELEAWFLSDPDNLKKSLKLKNIPKIKKNIETIISPKEYLGDLVLKNSDNEKRYVNTKHNKIISETISIDLVRGKCSSFDPFYNFVKKHI
jgi:ribosomal protein L7Ae-like RNA K-turn-binding protein